MTEVESAREDTPQVEQEPTPDMESLLEEHADYSLPRPGDIRVGQVLQVDQDGALIDIGFKREGFVSRDDLNQMQRAKMEEINVGDEVPVLILRSDPESYLDVSIYKARLAEDWLQAEKLLESSEIYEAEVSGYNRGGLTVQFGRIRGFVPLSHVVGMPRRLNEAQRKERLKKKVGQKIGLRVIEVDRRRRRLIFSQRQAYRSWQKKRKKQLLKELQEGERRSGRVTSITDFGVFVDLGGADGLVHLSELSWGRIDNPREIVDIGDEIEVLVLSVDQERERIALSLKQLQADPWSTVDVRYEEGQLVEGRVTQVSNIGAFVELEPGIEGLMHVSELVGAPAVVPEEVLQPNDNVLVKVIRVEKHRRRIGLSARRVRRDEWERWAAEKAEAEATEQEAAEEEAAVAEAEEAAEEEAAVAEAEEAAEEEAAVAEAEEAAEEEAAVAEAEEAAEEEAAVAEAEVDQPEEIAAEEPANREVAEVEEDVQQEPEAEEAAEEAAPPSEEDEADESADA